MLTFKQLDEKYYMPVFSRNIQIVRGNGCYVWDSTGNKYLDLVAGIAVCSTGHCHPHVTESICNQAKTLIHCSNLYYVPGQAELASRLSQVSGLGKVIFSNSGAEANEAALKLAIRSTGRHEFVSFEHDFHGRTIGSLACTHKPAIREPFEPLGLSCKFCPYGDLESLKSSVTTKTAAIIFEPIQGEAGVIIPPDDFIKGIRDICDDTGAIMICDEVQTGMGRTGKWFAYQHTPVTPDIVSIAKGIASGIPMGAIIAREGLEFTKGEHGSTFAGGPIACAAGNATLDVINEQLPTISTRGNRFMNGISKLNPRGKGLIIGFTPGDVNAQKIAEYCFNNGILINVANNENIRIVPPLVIQNEEIDNAISIINEASESV
ncbi:MAG TPA: acetylornithine/succinylornithine family transaminase [Methanocorpusculum sp.]|nr:acetylornithine/succinylornithine family transaminase [Methanocorpusculum sp.]